MSKFNIFRTVMWVVLFIITISMYFFPYFGAVDLPSSYGLQLVNIVICFSLSFLFVAAFMAAIKRTSQFPFITYSFLCLLACQPFLDYDPNFPQLRNELDILTTDYTSYLDDRLSIVSENDKTAISLEYNIGIEIQKLLATAKETRSEVDINSQLFQIQITNYIMKSHNFKELKYRINLIKTNFNKDYKKVASK